MPKFLTTRAAGAVPILPLAADELKPWLKSQPPAERSSVAAWVESLGFTAEAGTHCLLPGDGGALGRVLAGMDRSTRVSRPPMRPWAGPWAATLSGATARHATLPAWPGRKAPTGAR
jgi:hypothetical protein